MLLQSHVLTIVPQFALRIQQLRLRLGSVI